MNTYNFRNNVKAEDLENIREIISSSEFFNDEEISIAVELAEERLNKGLSSEYYFLFAELNGKTVGYTCFGPIPATKFSYDLYWIAVHQNQRGKGLGKILMEKTENEIRNLGGNRIYIETSGRDLYLPTREFYLNTKCRIEAELEDFYAPGDSKIIFLKVVD